ncbi:MAG: cytidylate kinase-like family protein [Muribaculaceae bacterium]|nr:cytidylate kinase-like family protein [Muribaculaceae bacterium]
MTSENIVITIGRQFGSGGRELGKLLANKLGFDFYDKELLLKAAKKAELSPELFNKSDERAPRFLGGTVSFAMGYNPYTFFSGPSSIGDDSINRALNDMIVSLAQKGRCIIVGRTADYVLRDHPGLVSIFVNASIDDCVDRITRRGDSMSRQQAAAMATKTNKLRASYYNFYTDKTWGDASSYHLCVNSSVMPMEDLADSIVEYIKRRFPDFKIVEK